ncbi:hypothetical protein EV426DRAFT_703656 [Tirmania nivea]|nr:hypothetical protein EV426DRAFT_703656 [Tirmania nivea]
MERGMWKRNSLRDLAPDCGPRSDTITTPGHYAQYTYMCLGVEAACIQELKGEIEDMNLRMEERFRGLWGIQMAEIRVGHSIEIVQECGSMKATGITDLEMRVGKVKEKLVKIEERIVKIEEKLAKIEGGYPSVQGSTQLDMERWVDKIEERLTLIESRHLSETFTLRVTSSCKGQQTNGGVREREKDEENGRKASVEVKTKEFAATVNGFPVVGLVIGIWVSTILYVLYSKEWLARRDRR